MKRISPVVIVGILLTILCGALFIRQPDFIQRLSLDAYDVLLATVVEPPESGAVAIVDIDDASLQEVGQWPWPRYLIADFTKKILDAGASVVAFDIVFAEEDRTSPDVMSRMLNQRYGLSAEVTGVPDELSDFDHLLAETVRGHPVIFGCQLQQAQVAEVKEVPEIDDGWVDTYPIKALAGTPPDVTLHSQILMADRMIVTIPELSKVARNAHFNAEPDHDNVVRRNPLIYAYGHDRIYPSLALEAVRLHTGGQGGIAHDQDGVSFVRLGGIRIPTDSHGRIPVKYRKIRDNWRSGFASTFPTFSVSDILNDQVPPESFKDMIVFVGTSAVGLKDIKSTPLTSEFSGVEVHATIVDNILAGDIMRIPAPAFMPAVDMTTIFLIGIGLTLLIDRGRSWLSFVAWVLACILSCILSWYLIQSRGLVYVPTWILISSWIIYPTLTMIKFWQEEVQKKRVRNMFGTMVSESVVRYMENNPESFSLSGRKMHATMLFSDVAGFTTISESLEPEQLSALLNRYLSPMTEIIQTRDGYVDKYEGDAIMAEWGVPLPTEDHALQACLSALEQMKKLDEIRQGLKDEFGHELFVRIGLNTGLVTAGNMGSEGRFQYTVMGDAVNLAARLEPANKEYDTRIIIGPETYEQAKDGIETRHLDKLVVKGKTEAVLIYELLGATGDTDETLMRVARLYEQALKTHMDRNWDDAERCLDEALALLPDDGPSLRLKRVIADYRVTPPPEGWTGAYVRTEK